MIQFTLYQVPLFLSCLASAIVLYSLSKREQSPGSRYLVVCILAAFVWALADLFNLGSFSLSNKLFWDNVSYIAIVIFPISWILFVFEYSGKTEYISNTLIALMSSFSLFILVLVWTNQYHYLFRSEIFLVEISGVLSFGKNYGPLFWLFILYFYVLIIVGSFILFQSFNLSNALNRKQKITFMIAIFFPWISNLLYLSRIITFPLDLTSISFSLMSLVLLIGITKYQLLDIVPTAYMNVFRNMNDGIIVLGRFNQIVEINPYMEKILGVESSKICGKKLKEISNIWPELNNKYLSLSSKNYNNNSNLTKGKNIFEMEVSNIYDSKNFLIGYLISLHDITNRKKMEDKLLKSNNQIENLNETLQVINKILRHDLLNKLTVMKYSLYLYQEKKDNSLIDKIDRSIDVSVELIKRIRDLESFILTKEELTPLQLRTVAEEVSANLNINSININGDATVLADHAIFSVFENIMRNALIHGKTDRIDVDINSKNKSCEIRIADYGKGIPEGIKDNIFEEGLSFGDSKGSGLGLYIVKKTIERYGGTISVEGNKPNGAVFIIKMKCL